jgi:hypothetical protein
MTARIILKHEEKEYLLQRTPENTLARSVLAAALPDEKQPALVGFSCDEQTAYAVLQIAERHCGCAWRVMHYQMARLGLLKSVRADHTAVHRDIGRNPEYHCQYFSDPAANPSVEMPLSSIALCDYQNESSSFNG